MTTSTQPTRSSARLAGKREDNLPPSRLPLRSSLKVSGKAETPSGVGDKDGVETLTNTVVTSGALAPEPKMRGTAEAIQALQSQLSSINAQVALLATELAEERTIRLQAELERSRERREVTEALKRIEKLLRKKSSSNERQGGNSRSDQPGRNANPSEAVTRPKVIKVKVPEGVNYVDMYRQIRADSSINEHVLQAARTADKVLSITLKRESDGQAALAIVQKALGETGQARLMVPRTVVIVSNIDMLATMNDTIEAVKRKLAVEVTALDISQWTNERSGLQTARISVPVEALKKVADRQLVIGLTRCTMRELPPVPVSERRCVRCHHRGHQARNCRSREDRTEMCLRCGSKEH
ncbi:gag-like protein [Anopheles sinensis]|uniref:Gag-like protein n=1 Tax=Anopheles sinensis TaxID=74873 RepID=A0A084VLX9_ANOSI|nr:gag-like protein [Anopheles sinensis]